MKIILTLLLFISQLSAQIITLSGQVSIHNSRCNTGEIIYVKDAEVSTPFAGAKITGDSGKFDLGFVGFEAVTSVQK